MKTTITKEEYDWGTLIKATKGNAYSLILHPQHITAINKLDEDDTTFFKDEQGISWATTRVGPVVVIEADHRHFTIDLDVLK